MYGVYGVGWAKLSIYINPILFYFSKKKKDFERIFYSNLTFTIHTIHTIHSTLKKKGK